MPDARATTGPGSGRASLAWHRGDATAGGDLRRWRRQPVAPSLTSKVTTRVSSCVGPGNTDALRPRVGVTAGTSAPPSPWKNRCHPIAPCASVTCRIATTAPGPPTGSGKTLAAFLHALDGLPRQGAALRDELQVVYVSPLRALANDVQKSLRSRCTNCTRDRRCPEVHVPAAA
ncbi:MAG: DEAD/DEAH box helicase [Planctomycetes bacterium]|nr:DEAD/DEAH box helicase [Planctomycetota bacterium]